MKKFDQWIAAALVMAALCLTSGCVEEPRVELDEALPHYRAPSDPGQ
jgi:hypothetical protein